MHKRTRHKGVFEILTQHMHMFLNPHLIVLSLHRHREAEEERETGTLLDYHISLRFSPVVGQQLVSIHTAGHRMATLQFSGQFELCAICGRDGISVLVRTNVSEHRFQ